MITCYRDLHTFLRRRADSLGIARDRIDELAGLPTRYAATVLAPDGAKRMSIDTAFAIAGALGGALAFIESPEAMVRIAEAIGSRTPGRVTASRRSSRARKRKKLLRDLMKNARSVRNVKLTPAERSRIAQIAGRASGKARRRRGGGSSRRITKCPKSAGHDKRISVPALR